MRLVAPAHGLWFRPRMLRTMVRMGFAASLVAVAACKSELPAPAYPSPEDPPLEETELWPYFEADGAESGEWQEEEDEDWDEGEEDVDADPGAAGAATAE